MEDYNNVTADTTMQEHYALLERDRLQGAKDLGPSYLGPLKPAEGRSGVVAASRLDQDFNIIPSDISEDVQQAAYDGAIKPKPKSTGVEVRLEPTTHTRQVTTTKPLPATDASSVMPNYQTQESTASVTVPTPVPSYEGTGMGTDTIGFEDDITIVGNVADMQSGKTMSFEEYENMDVSIVGRAPYSPRVQAKQDKLDAAERLGMASQPLTLNSIKDLKTDSIQSYAQYRMAENPDVLATEILRDMQRKFGKEALEPEVLLTIRQYLRNPHDLSSVTEAPLSGALALGEGLAQTALGAGSAVTGFFDWLTDGPGTPKSGDTMSFEEYEANGVGTDITAWFDNKAKTLGERAEFRNQEVLAKTGAMAPMLAASAKIIPTAASALAYELGQGESGLSAIGSAALDTATLKIGGKLFDWLSTSPVAEWGAKQVEDLPKSWQKEVQLLADRQGSTPAQVWEDAKAYLSKVDETNPSTQTTLRVATQQTPALSKDISKLGDKTLGLPSELAVDATNRSLRAHADDLLGQFTTPHTKLYADGKHVVTDWEKAYEDVVTLRRDMPDGRFEEQFNVTPAEAIELEDTLRLFGKFDDMAQAVRVSSGRIDYSPSGLDIYDASGKIKDTGKSDIVSAVQSPPQIAFSASPTVAVLRNAYTFLKSKLPGHQADRLMQNLVTDMSKGRINSDPLQIEQQIQRYLQDPTRID